MRTMRTFRSPRSQTLSRSNFRDMRDNDEPEYTAQNHDDYPEHRVNPWASAKSAKPVRTVTKDPSLTVKASTARARRVRTEKWTKTMKAALKQRRSKTRAERRELSNNAQR